MTFEPLQSGSSGIYSCVHKSSFDNLYRIHRDDDNAPVDEDTDGGDGESSVQALDAVGLEGLDVHVDQTVELSLTTLALGIVGQPGSID